MENQVKWLAWVLVVIAALGGGYFYLKVQPPGGESPSPSVALASFTNARGQEWKIPEGDFQFSVSSDRSIYPSFLWGDINPLKVVPGDTQTMRVIVGDKVPVKSVIATIETDTKKFEVPLRFVRTEARASPETAVMEARYSVDENGLLVVNDEATIAKAVETGIIPSAHAQDMVRYVFEGEWMVEDTHRRTYHTIFTAENENGEKNTLVMAWSDPCLFFNNAVAIACTVAAQSIEGVPNTNYSITQNVTLAGTGVGNEAVLAFSPGRSISIAGGSISIGGTHPYSKVQQTSLYHADGDGDKFIGNNGEFLTSGTYEASTFYGSDVDTGHRNPTSAQSSDIARSPLERTYSFVDELVRKVFAVGPCPGNPACTPPPHPTWSNPTLVYAADGSAASVSSPTDTSQYLITSGHTFSLPVTATTTAEVAGVEVKVRARVSGGSATIVPFVGLFSGSQVGSPVTISNTAFQDFYFGGLGTLWGGLTYTTTNSVNFGAQVQAYDASGGNTVYVDHVSIRIYYKTVPTVDGDDSFSSTCLNGAGLVNCVHTSVQCSSAGGTRVVAGGPSVCRFNGITIPGGWTAYGSPGWSQTTATFCSGAASNPFPQLASIPTAGAACAQNSCTTGSHTWANTARETCDYYDISDTLCQNPITCPANYTYRGAY